MNPKISLIGAGSVVFAKNLLGDILQFPELANSTICLMDIDPTRLRVAEAMAKKMVAKLKVGAKIEATLNQKQAIRNANYVICTIQVGGYKPGTITDFEIPRKYGLLQTIGDTLGVGGVFRALRTIPVINKIAQDIADIGAPNCLFLNYSNPMAMNCWGISRSTGVPHVGLCHSVQGTSQQLASYAGLSYEDISYLVAGINHMAFFLKFEYKKQDAYPILFKLLENPNFQYDKVRFEMMRRTGYFVTESSEHQSEYVPYFIHHGNEVIKKFDVPIDEYLRRCEAIIRTWKKTESVLIGKDGEIDIRPQTHEYGSYIIHSRETGVSRVIYGNVPNTDLITNLPKGCCVEVPCLVDKNGIQPTYIGDLPPQLAALCRSNINVQELTVEAAMTKKREHIYQAVMMDPHAATVLTLDKIWNMCDDLIEAHQKHGFLGEFSKTIPNTGRSYQGTGDRVIAKLEVNEDSFAKENLELELNLVVSNPLPKTQKLTFEASCKGVYFASNQKQKISISVPANKEIRKKFSVLRNPSAEQKGSVLLNTSTAGVFVQGLNLLPRKQLRLENGSGAPFIIQLAGNDAVQGRLFAEKDVLKLKINVSDSNILEWDGKTDPWRISCVELFFADGNKSPIRHIYCLPEKGKSKPRIIDNKWNPVPSVEAKQKITPIGYEVELTIPRKAVNLSSNKPVFLFDSIVNLNALGDAHSGGRTGLNGRLDSPRRSSHYARVVLN
jgi:alpha-galactosidase/6-phospho-beta-glucosidase family protein